MPFLDPISQTLTVRQTFWHRAGGKKREGVQIWPDKIAFNLIGELGNLRDYEELDQMRERWLMLWGGHFGVSESVGVTLEYVNLISSETLPGFIKMEHDCCR